MKTRAGWLNTSQATEHLELLEAEQPIATAGKQLEEEEEEGRGKRRGKERRRRGMMMRRRIAEQINRRGSQGWVWKNLKV